MLFFIISDPIIDFMHGSSMAVAFSIASKTVDSTEIGERCANIVFFKKLLVKLSIIHTY